MTRETEFALRKTQKKVDDTIYDGWFSEGNSLYSLYSVCLYALLYLPINNTS